MNDIKYKQGINANAYNSCMGKGIRVIAYITKKVVKANKAKAKQSIMLKSCSCKDENRQTIRIQQQGMVLVSATLKHYEK